MDKLLEGYAPLCREMGATAEVHIDSWTGLAKFYAKADDSHARLEVRPFDLNISSFLSDRSERQNVQGKGLEITVHGGMAKTKTFRRAMIKGFTPEGFHEKFAACFASFKESVLELRAKSETEMTNTKLNEALMKQIDFMERQPRLETYDYGEHPSAGPNYIQGKLRNGFQVRIQVFRVPHNSFAMNIETFGGLSEEQVLEIIRRLNDPKFGARIR
jgi:hypothetical protein